MVKYLVIRYEGQFKNNRRQGRGRYLYNNGDEYIGDFQNDKKHGLGMYKS